LAPLKLIGIGLVLVIIGVIGPVLMVLELVETTYWLSFLSYGASTCGLILGMTGSAFYARVRIKEKERE